MPAIASLECARCHHHVSPLNARGAPQLMCPVDQGPLYVRYDMALLKSIGRPGSTPSTGTRPPGIARYASVLPDVAFVSLAEGSTPILQSGRHPNLLIKEEGGNSGGSSAARGLSLAVSMARDYGIAHLAMACSGPAAAALAAYAAAAQMQAHIVMPRVLSDADFACYVQASACGADIHLVDGLPAKSAEMLANAINLQREADTSACDMWHDVSLLKEPFRLEGEKTMGYELAEQLNWTYPDAVFYPAETGLLAIDKAFEEMEQLGWMEQGSSGEPLKRPRMYAVQPAAKEAPNLIAERTGPDAGGYGDIVAANVLAEMIADVVAHSGGRVLTLSQAEIQASMLDYARSEGIFLCPDGAAGTAAYDSLLASGELKASERVVVFNPVAASMCTGILAMALRLRRGTALPTSLPVGGIITPV